MTRRQSLDDEAAVFTRECSRTGSRRWQAFSTTTVAKPIGAPFAMLSTRPATVAPPWAYAIDETDDRLSSRSRARRDMPSPYGDPPSPVNGPTRRRFNNCLPKW